MNQNGKELEGLRVAPVWVLTWILKLLGRLNRFPHVGQTCFFPSSATPSSPSSASSISASPSEEPEDEWRDEGRVRTGAKSGRRGRLEAMCCSDAPRGSLLRTSNEKECCSWGGWGGGTK